MQWFTFPVHDSLLAQLFPAAGCQHHPAQIRAVTRPPHLPLEAFPCLQWLVPLGSARCQGCCGQGNAPSEQQASAAHHHVHTHSSFNEVRSLKIHRSEYKSSAFWIYSLIKAFFNLLWQKKSTAQIDLIYSTVPIWSKLLLNHTEKAAVPWASWILQYMTSTKQLTHSNMCLSNGWFTGEQGTPCLRPKKCWY